ncbi:DUF1176 domain-containing protein [uncultured Thiothrix sp.]|uniref:DUF1176 domain-containing protein n=1 Tax=uncultured Thiothrix sp. TaxID=223185 RepID=UPI002635D38D|nr:DUF1176 domain-containing protein [uncultured Thiothrix sp.]
MKSKFILLGVLSLGVPLSYGADKATDYPVKDFKDWAVACNNLRECSATSFVAPSEVASDPTPVGGDLVLTLERGAAVDSLIKLGFLNTSEDEWNEKLVGEDISISIDEQTFDLGKLTKQQVADLKVELTHEQATVMLAAAQKSPSLSVLVGNIMNDISLSGLSAVLLYMDEQQQRLDTSTALFKKGTKTFTTIRPDVPTVTPKIPSAETQVTDSKYSEILDTTRKLNLTALKTCNEEKATNREELDTVDVLDNQHYLISLNCGGGAYNFNTLFLVAPKNDLKQTKLAKFDQGADDSTVVGYAEYDNRTGLLNYSSKGRGLGDCGSVGAWAWTGEEFVLVSSNDMADCRGNLNFLNTWRLNLASPKTE